MLTTANEISSGLIIPSLMPDEFLAGYAGRVCKLNDFNDLEALRLQYYKKYLKKNPEHQKQQLLTYLAKELQLTEEFLFKHHTVLKVWQKHSRVSNNSFDAHKRWSCILKADQSTHAFCEKCISEDLNFHGFSYWKTQHQIHGFDVCYKHENEPLKYRQSNNSLRYSPFWNLRSNNSQTNLIDSNSSNNVFINRYQRFIKEYLDSDTILPVRKLSTHLRNTINSDEWKIKRNVDISSPSQYIVDNFPKEWLEIHFSAFFKHNTSKIPALDRCLNPYSADPLTEVTLIILAMAAFLESSDFWSFQAKFKTKHQLRAIPREKDNEILESFIRNGKSIKQTAIDLNLNYDGLRKRLKKIQKGIGTADKNSETTKLLLSQIPIRNYTRQLVNI